MNYMKIFSPLYSCFPISLAVLILSSISFAGEYETLTVCGVLKDKKGSQLSTTTDVHVIATGERNSDYSETSGSINLSKSFAFDSKVHVCVDFAGTPPTTGHGARPFRGFVVKNLSAKTKSGVIHGTITGTRKTISASIVDVVFETSSPAGSQLPYVISEAIKNESKEKSLEKIHKGAVPETEGEAQRAI